MRESRPVQVMVHRPQSREGRQELAARVAQVHADAAAESIRRLDCPAGQKLELLQAVLEAVREGKPTA